MRETSQSLTEPSIGGYLSVLKQLSECGFLSGAVLYPACGVDALVSLFADKLVGINLYHYTAEDVFEHLRPIIGLDTANALQKGLIAKAEFISGVNASNANALTLALGKYRESAPKTLLLKGLFDSIFLMEWDSDVERYYDVQHGEAIGSATRWVEKMTAWLQNGDKVVCFDDAMLLSLDSQESLVRRREFRSEGGHDQIVHRGGCPIIYLNNKAVVYEVSAAQTRKPG